MKIGISCSHIKKKDNDREHELGVLEFYIEKLITNEPDTEIYLIDIDWLSILDRRKLRIGKYKPFKEFVRMSRPKVYTDDVGRLDAIIYSSTLMINDLLIEDMTISLDRFNKSFDQLNFKPINQEKLYRYAYNETDIVNALTEGLLLISSDKFNSIVGNKFLDSNDGIKEKISSMEQIEYDYIVNLQRSNALKVYGNIPYHEFKALLLKACNYDKREVINDKL